MYVTANAIRLSHYNHLLINLIKSRIILLSDTSIKLKRILTRFLSKNIDILGAIL